jgi:hypothetical protein
MTMPSQAGPGPEQQEPDRWWCGCLILERQGLEK